MDRSIPIENIYYLLCYSWNQLEEGELVDLKSEACETLQDLFAIVLTRGTQRLIRRGFHRAYVNQSEESGSLRGRIALTPSIRDLSWVRGRMHCAFNELSYNVLPNRILKTTLQNLYSNAKLTKEIKDGLGEVLRVLDPVQPVRLSGRIFRRIQYNQNMRFYRFLLNVCELIFESMILSEEEGGVPFRDFFRDKDKMPKLFEGFVRNFYSQHATSWKVHPSNKRFSWFDLQGPPDALTHVPLMETDIDLQNSSQRIILDCKFYLNAFSERHEKFSFHSSNLYQMYAYLQNGTLHHPELKHFGVLLYPETVANFRHTITLQGFPITFASVNLNQPWQKIHHDLLEVIG